MSLDKTVDVARGKWRGILINLGVDEKYLQDKHGPCVRCGGKDRFRFDDKDGNGTWFCSYCGAGGGIHLLQLVHGWDFKKAAYEVDRIVGNVKMEPIKDAQTEEQKLANIQKVWREARRLVPSDPVFTYLDSRCGVLDPTRLDDIRYHPGLYHPEAQAKLPCMLALLRYVDGKGATIHRTYLTHDGKKANVSAVRRLMPGKTPMGASVWLGSPWEEVCVAEGIETALCSSKRMGVPACAAISAEGMKAWVPPACVKKVYVMADNDASFTGQAAAFHLARELVMQRKLAVEVHTPECKGNDWCDLHIRV